MEPEDPQTHAFDFALGAEVVIDASGEHGRVIGRAQYETSDDNYLIRYRDGSGSAVEQWWTRSALVTASL